MFILKESFEESLALCFIHITSPGLNLNCFEEFYLKVSKAYYTGHTCLTLLLPSLLNGEVNLLISVAVVHQDSGVLF